MPRVAAVAALVVLLLPPPLIAGSVDESAYAAANARLARGTPHYPRSALLVEEPLQGEIGNAGFLGVQRIYAPSGATSQSSAVRVYRKKLKRYWRRRGDQCFVYGRRLIAIVANTAGTRVAIFVDSRGASRCAGISSLIVDLLEAGYPDR